MTTLDRPITADELLEMPDDGFRYELVAGELRRRTPAGDAHGEIAATLSGLLFAHVRAHGLGRVYAAETGFRLATDPDTVRAPDVAFVRRERVAPPAGSRASGRGRRIWRPRSSPPATPTPKWRRRSSTGSTPAAAWSSSSFRGPVR